MIDHVLLIIYFKALVAITRRRALILDVVDDGHIRDSQWALLHVGVILAVLAAVNVTILDVEHGNDRTKQVLHESFLLGDQQRPGLQLGQHDVDWIDRWRHQVGPIVLGVFQQRAAIGRVEVEQAAQVRPVIRLLWALDVHRDDEVVLHA